MRFFELLNFQHVMLYIFPTLIFIVLLGLGLGFVHFQGKRSKERMTEVTHSFADGLEDRNAPFPLVLGLIIAGTLVWAFFYIFVIGLTDWKI